MDILENYSLKKYNTFGIEVNTNYFISLHSVEDIHNYIETYGSIAKKQLVLGGGSNILFTKDFDGTVIKNDLKGIELVKETAREYYVKASAGENWHKFVSHCVEKGYAGIENLSLIPGNVGASPIQNIGAYGVEAKDYIYSVEAIHLKNNLEVVFSNKECEFGYRNSIFKHKEKGNFIITSVLFRLKKKPDFNIAYGAIRKELDSMNIDQLSLKAISKAVIKIRTNKLPDYTVLGNTGSFFKNPIIKKEEANKLKAKYENIPIYNLDNGDCKVSAAWLIDRCGWKGKRIGNCGVYNKHALVLVNYGDAEGKEIYALSEKIIKDVENEFHIVLEREVNVL